MNRIYFSDSQLLFVIGFNVRCILKRKILRARLHQQKMIVIHENQEVRYAPTPSRAALYKQGIQARGDHLGEVYYLKQIQFNSGDIIVDCGANMGDLALYFKNRNLQIVYIGIEPNPTDFQCLQLNQISGEIHNVGLWATSTTLPFYISTAAASSSFIEPPVFSKVIDIRAVPLSEIVGAREIKLLKLEAEGAEPEVLIGCESVLAQIEYISADVGPERGLAEESTRNEVVSYLTTRKFVIIEEQLKHRKTVLFRNQSRIAN